MRAALSIHIYITILVVGTVVPFLLFSGLLVDRSANSEQELIARTVRNSARSAAADLNRQIGALQALAFAIAGSRLLQNGEFAAFHVQASELVRRGDLTAIVYDTAGQQLVNTTLPFGVVLPTDPDAVMQVVESGQAEISDLPQAPQTGTLVIRIAVPVMRDHRLTYILALQLSSAIASTMSEQIVLPEQTIGLVDRRGSVIYRTPESDRVVRLRAPSDFLQRTQGLDEGAFHTISNAGIPVYVAFSRIKLAGWVLAVSIPTHVLFAPVHRSLLRLLALGAGTLLLAGLIGWAIGRAIAKPVADLSRLAAGLGAGLRIENPPATHIREIDAVGASMVGASDLLRQQNEQLDSDVDTLRTEVASRRRVEHQLAQSQKMEAVGQLTGGLAHDFNNLLAIIIGSLDLLRDRQNDDPESEELAGAALSAALRGAELIRQMLAFARRQPLMPEQCDVNRVISVFVGLLRRTLGEDIAIDLQLATGLRPVLVDRVQLEAAITNLATNARDAMPHGGRLTIATRSVFLDEDYAAAHAEVTPGAYVSIEVHDTGTGMPPVVLDRIFEPFFTTKEQGRGTGLGLSMVFGFMKQSGGHVSAYSEVGEGTTFRLYLPSVHDPATHAHAPLQRFSEPGCGATILAVEDSSGLRQLLARQLTTAGYRVLEADNARTALDAIEGDEPIDLLLTDIVMPGGMNGHELARVAVERRPNLKTLLTSGFSDAANGAARAQNARILRKPYRREELLCIVRETLQD